METRANHILIGGFIVLSTLLAFGFMFWIQNYGTGSSSARYAILFKGPVTGLAPASNVLFNGLKVGQVDSFEIDPVDPRNTRVFIFIKKDTPVRINSTARIISQGLSAFSAVMITPGTPDAKLMAMALKPGETPTIKAVAGGASSLMEAAPEVLNNVNTVLRRVDELVANNENLVRQTLKNIEGFTRELEGNKKKIGAFMDDASIAARQIREVADKLNAFMSANEASLNQTMSSIAATSKNAESFSDMLVEKQADIAATIENARAISEQLKGVATKLDTTLDGLSGMLSNEDGKSVLTEISAAATSFRDLADKLDKSLGNSADGMARFAKNGLREFELLMRQGRQMVKTMDRVMNKLDKNPQGLLFGNKQVREYNAN